MLIIILQTLSRCYDAKPAVNSEYPRIERIINGFLQVLTTLTIDPIANEDVATFFRQLVQVCVG
jgi:hypothetical protein